MIKWLLINLGVKIKIEALTEAQAAHFLTWDKH